MGMDPIDYLDWAIAHGGRTAWSLASSAIAPVPPDQLGFSLDGIPFASPPGEEHEGLGAAVARRYGVPPDHVLLVPSTTTANFLIAAALLDPEQDEILAETPGYPPLLQTPAHFSRGMRLVRRIVKNRFAVEVDAVRRALSLKTRIAWFTDPHNPSGVRTPPETWRAVGALLEERDGWVVVDEVYRDFLFDAKPGTAATAARNVLATGSLSKAWGFAGLRMGWVLGDPAALAKVRIAYRHVQGSYPWFLAEVAFRVLKDAPRFLSRVRKIGDRNRKIVESWIKGRDDVRWVAGDGPVIGVLELPPGVDARKLSERARAEHDLLLNPGDFFGLPGALRLGFGHEDDTKLRGALERLGKVLDAAE